MGGSVMFYTYAHYKPNGEIFYIGKGQGNRAKEMRRKNLLWKKVVEEFGKPVVKIIAYWDTEKEAYDHEILLISCFRGMGYNLTNITEGGGCASGYKRVSPVWNKGKPVSEETRKKISLSLKGNISWNKGKKQIYSEESLEKMKLAKLGKPSPRKGQNHSEETKRKMSESHIKSMTDEVKQKISASKKGIVIDEAWRKKLSEATKKYWKRKKMAQNISLIKVN